MVKHMGLLLKDALMENAGAQFLLWKEEHIASEGDFIIKGVNGEFYPCKPDIFWKTYTLVN